MLGSNNIAAIGGVFRDHDANWTCEFTMRIGKDSIFKTELECDNALVVETILASGAGISLLLELRLISKLLCRNWKVRLQHIPREHNRVADWITKLGNSNYDEMHVFEEAPILLRELLKIDLNPICRDINWVGRVRGTSQLIAGTKPKTIPAQPSTWVLRPTKSPLYPLRDPLYIIYL
ncbi:hypothetical protein Goari_016887 [Gossypium aridum]|uniref:RNase H type-1 domain-containing protein n=1 Tax=Gossypium aridum TaxID=34290 RepID=A0A7J8WJW1_GOSAI|nr:hypothetical protein [Gossypium aridum]